MSSFWRDRPWRLRTAALVLAAALALLIQGYAAPALTLVEEAFGDLTWRAAPSPSIERRVVVVDIDEASLNAVGAWPWSRTTLARLSTRLEEAGAVVQAFDIVLDSSRDGDDELAELWRSLPVVAGQVFSLDPAATPQVGVVAGALEAASCPSVAPQSVGHVANSATLVGPTSVVGHLTPRIENDGVVRKVPAVICHAGRAYPSLALAALWRAAQASGPARSRPDWKLLDAAAPGARSSKLQLRPEAVFASASLPGLDVPVDRRGDMRVPFRVARNAWVSVPAHKVLAGTADPSLLKGAIVLVGATAFGIGDVTATPLSRSAAGVEIHAQALAGLLDHGVPYTPVETPWLQLLVAGVIAALLVAVASRRADAPVKRLPIAGAMLAVSLMVGASVCLITLNLWLPWALPAVFALLASSALATAEHALTRQQSQRLSAHLGSYLPGPVARRLMAIDPTGTIQVDQREVTVLVADIRNFSAQASHRPPQETAALLHAFYCIAVDVVERHGGVVENVVGDSVLAVWNAYADTADHAERATAAAKELVRATYPLLEKTPSAGDADSVQPLALGVGVESGPAIVGSFGPARRRAHAALGEPVSVASRLQKMTQDLSIPVLLGPRLAEHLPATGTEPLGDYLLEGMSRQYAVYAPSDWASLAPTGQLWAGLGGPASDPPLSTDGWWQGRERDIATKLVPSPARDA